MNKHFTNFLLSIATLFLLSSCSREQVDICFFEKNKDFIPIHYLNEVDDRFQVNNTVHLSDYAEVGQDKFIEDALAFEAGIIARTVDEWQALIASYPLIDFNFNYSDELFATKSVVVFARINGLDGDNELSYLTRKGVVIRENELRVSISDCGDFHFQANDPYSTIQLYSAPFEDEEKGVIDTIKLKFYQEKYYCIEYK